MSRSREKAPPRLPFALLLPGLLYAYPAVASWLSASQQPMILGRYSSSFFAFNLWGLCVLGLLVMAWRRRQPGLVAAALVLLVGTTVLLPANNQLRELPGILILLPAIRMTAGLALAFAGFLGHRSGNRRGGLAAGAGAVLVLLSCADLVLLAVLAGAPEQRQQDRAQRVEYDLERISGMDVVLVGDSFVWGQGVEPEQRFGDRLQARLAGDGLASRVYSLGLLGVGPIQYAGMLEEIPESSKADRVIVAFYPNDMPTPENLLRSIENVTGSLGYGFPSLRLAGDKLAGILVDDVDSYHGLVIDSYREDGPGFERRWAMLGQQLAHLHDVATACSQRKPLFMILPIMVGFHDYPLADVHAKLVALAESKGYETLDLYPFFRQNINNAEPFLVAPDDNHFNDQVHDVVARILLDRLTSLDPDPAGLP